MPRAWLDNQSAVLIATSGSCRECPSGGYKSGKTCIKVRVPPNARLKQFGNDFRYHGSGKRRVPVSKPVTIPLNARLTIDETDWECNRGFRRSASTYIANRVPPNARLNVLRNDLNVI